MRVSDRMREKYGESERRKERERESQIKEREREIKPRNERIV